jgi:hypothetical protein
MNNPELSTMNAMEFNAFRNTLRDVVIIGWCSRDRETVSDVPEESFLDEKVWDDGTTQYGMRILYRLATPSDKSGKIKISMLDKLDPYRSRVGYRTAPKSFFDLLLKECPEGYRAGDLGTLPNEIVEYRAIQMEVSRRRDAEASEGTDDVVIHR